MGEDDTVGFEVNEEVVLQDLDAVQEQKQLLPIASGVRVKIERPTIKKSLSDNGKEAPAEGVNNPVAYKKINLNYRILDGISVPVFDDNGSETGAVEMRYKNKVMFSGNMDLVYWHNPEVKTTDWWKNKQYIFSFRSLIKALGFDTKQVAVNDAFLESLVDREILVDIEHEPVQKNVDGKWVDSGTFKNKITNIRKWE